MELRRMDDEVVEKWDHRRQVNAAVQTLCLLRLQTVVLKVLMSLTLKTRTAR